MAATPRTFVATILAVVVAIVAFGVAAMIPSLFVAFLAAVAVGVAPGFFWARLLVPTRDLYVRLAFSVALSFALVPAFAVFLAKVFGSGVTLPIAVAAPSLVFVAGLAASIAFGRAENEKDVPLSKVSAPLSGYALALFVPAVGMALLAFFGIVPAAPTLLPIAILIAFAAATHAVTPRREDDELPPSGEPRREVDETPPSGESRREVDETPPSGGAWREADGTSPSGQTISGEPPSDGSREDHGTPPRKTPTSGGPLSGEPRGKTGGSSLRGTSTSDEPSSGGAWRDDSGDGAPPRKRSWDAMRSPGFGIVRAMLFPVVFGFVLLRYYLGVALHDWPYLRGGDLYSHAVMTNRMMDEGEILPYLVYPPGFHTMTAILARITNLDPLELFPLLIPAVMALPALALYALATKLWGWPYGVAAAAMSGLALGSTYSCFDIAMYPNVAAAQFLLPMAVAALVFSYANPTIRSAVLVALLGASVVLFHPVGSLYTAALLGAAGIIFLPYLLLKAYRERPENGMKKEPRGFGNPLAEALRRVRGQFVGRKGAGKGESGNPPDARLPTPHSLESRRISGKFLRTAAALFGAFAMLGVLAVAYAWETYDLPGIVGGFVGGSQTGSGGYAVASAVGTQGWLPLEHFLDSITAPILWLGLLGAFLLLFTKNDGTPSLLSRHTLLLWAVILFVGSRTALSGFPVRFERDLGIPLALLAAFALGALVKSLVAFRAGGKTTLATAAVAVALVAVLFGAQIFQSFERATEAPADYLMTPEISEAGAWLRSHNEGGNIIVGPHQNQVASRAMLAMGDYSALQSFTPSRISYDRDLPPHGPEPMWDVLRAINYPTEERTARILDEYDVRYVVFYKRFDPGTSWGSTAPVEWWRNYEASPELYDTAFENEGVVIFEPREGVRAGFDPSEKNTF